MLAGLPVDVALSDARSQLRSMAALGLGALALVILLGLLLQRRLARPVCDLGAAIAASRAGDREARAPVTGPTEVVEVASAFNVLITERQALEDYLRHSALHDPLTGLPNRSYLGTLLDDLIAGGGADPLAVLFLDLDRFKLINDSFGHAVGDQLLVALAERLVASVPSGTTVCRFGGDEFVLICPRCENPAAEADRFAKIVQAGFRINGAEMFVGGSVGIAIASAGETAEDVIRNADTAMYRAKEDGRNRAALFDDAMRTWAVGRMTLERDLHSALERGQFTLHYQPKFDIATGDVVGLEALLRWAHPERGTVSPAEFIPVAEDTGLIVPIGEWVMREAARQALEWRGQHGRFVPVAVNLAARQLAHSDVRAALVHAFERTGAEPGDLYLEVTESAVLTDVDTAIAQLESVRDLGVKVSIDDFGTGYSSLSYLQRLPADELKVDRAFVSVMAQDRASKAIVSSVVDLAHAIGLSVVAEGVEEAAQLDSLRDVGCDLAQGYYLGRPVPAPDASLVLRARQPSLLK